MLTLQTVEGNTSSGVAGSQSDGDGVFQRRRVVASKTVGFIRIPGNIADPTPAPTPAPVVPAQPDAHGEAKNDAPFTTPVPPATPELVSEHGQQ